MLYASMFFAGECMYLSFFFNCIDDVLSFFVKAKTPPRLNMQLSTSCSQSILIILSSSKEVSLVQ